LKQEIASKFCFNPSDAAEILVSYFNDLKKTFIQTEQDFLDFIKKNIYKVDLDISQESQLYKNSMKKLQEETELDIKTLEGLIKANEEIENKKKAYVDEKNKQIKDLDEKIKAITKQKTALMKETNKEKEIMNKEIKTNQKKIEELQKKLGLKITPIKEVKKPASPKPKPKPQPKKKPIVKKIAKKVVKITKKVENKKKEEKTQENEEKGFLNIDNLTQNITQKIGEIGKMVLPLANQIVNKINENLDKKEIKLKAGAPNQEENKKVHVGIHCNGCGVNPIVGNRFKCAICDNFDYCEKCESLNKDSHKHPFIKIYSPENAPVEIKCELK
jgi:exonuclease VII large subunit